MQQKHNEKMDRLLRDRYALVGQETGITKGDHLQLLAAEMGLLTAEWMRDAKNGNCGCDKPHPQHDLNENYPKQRFDEEYNRLMKPLMDAIDQIKTADRLEIIIGDPLKPRQATEVN